MASTWGGTAIPAPTAYSRQRDFVGTQYILSDGSMQTDSITGKWKVSLQFADITEAEKNTLVTKATTISSAALVIDDEPSENVIPIAGSCSVSRLAGGTQVYTVSCEVRTV